MHTAALARLLFTRRSGRCDRVDVALINVRAAQAELTRVGNDGGDDLPHAWGVRLIAGLLPAFLPVFELQ